MTIQQEAVDKLREFLSNCRIQEEVGRAKVRPCFYGTVVCQNDILHSFFHPTPACHSQFSSSLSKYLALGTSSPIIERNEEVAKRFHNWFFSPTNSPWRELLKYGVEFVDLKQTGKIGAFILGPDLCNEIGKTIDWYAIKNMFITARCIYEKTEYMETWCDLLDEGITPDVAFLVCSIVKKENDLYKYSSENYQGHHWGITLEDTNLTNFRNGNCNQFVHIYPTDHKGRINCVFKGTKNCLGLITLFREKLKEIHKISTFDGRFYSSDGPFHNLSIDKRDIIELINKWVKTQ